MFDDTVREELISYELEFINRQLETAKIQLDAAQEGFDILLEEVGRLEEELFLIKCAKEYEKALEEGREDDYSPFVNPSF